MTKIKPSIFPTEMHSPRLCAKYKTPVRDSTVGASTPWWCPNCHANVLTVQRWYPLPTNEGNPPTGTLA